MKITFLAVALLLISGCGAARSMEEWQREKETFKQLDEAYKAGRISEKEYFDYKARLMNKERSVNVNSNSYKPYQPAPVPGAAQLRKYNPYLN